MSGFYTMGNRAAIGKASDSSLPNHSSQKQRESKRFFVCFLRMVGKQFPA